MGFSIENQQSETGQYQAPSPVFIRTVVALGQGFPWDRFERLFKHQPLIQATAKDQVFVLRVLALQELLCTDDEAMVRWLNNQMHLFAFITDAHPRVPSAVQLRLFRQKLDEISVLQPFRKRCQRIILKHEMLSESDTPVDGKGLEGGDSADLVPLMMTEIEERWVICPLCDSSSLESYIPDHLTASDHEPWADCQQCGHKFRVG